MSLLLLHFGPMLVLLGLSGFFSASETALFSLNPLQRKAMQAEGGRFAKLAVQLSERRRQALRTILLGNLIVNVSFYSLSTTLAIGIAAGHGAAGASLRAGAIGLACLAVLILFGEVFPKLIAVNFSRQIACLAALPIDVIHRLLEPVWQRTDAIFDRLAGHLRFGSRHVRRLATDELHQLVGFSEQRGVITSLESSLIAEAVELADLKVSEVMVPRVDVTCFDVRRPLEELRELIRQTQHSKIPIFRGSRENILGIVRGRDVLLSDHTMLEALMRPARFIPELASLGVALEQLRQDATHVAIAVDEYGGFAGLITLQDVLEEVVGEIEGEHEPSQPLVEQLAPARYRLAGALSLRDWGELSGVKVSFPNFGTVGGLVMLLLGRVPREGDRVVFEDLTFTVERVQRHRVASVLAEFDTNRAQGAGARA
jgi:CBS domain containing-hemolysin-like protein